MSDPASSILLALAMLLGLKDAEPKEVARGDVASAFPEVSSPGEVIANVLLVVDPPLWDDLRARLADPSRQPGALAAGRLDTSEGVERFVRSARLDEGDSDRLKQCREGQCKTKVTAPLLRAQEELPQKASDQARIQAHLRALAGLVPCVREPTCELTLIGPQQPVPLGPVSKRLRALPSLGQQITDASEAKGSSWTEWRTETYWKREILSLSRVRLVEGRFQSFRAILHQRQIVFATHYFYGARVETLFVEVGERLVVAQSNVFQTDKATPFNGIQRALIRLLGRRRFESQAREWGKEQRPEPATSP